MQKKIAFFSTHKHHINNNLYEKFVEYFSGYEIEFIEIFQIFKRKKHIYFLNMVFVILEYGLELLLRRKKFVECFFRTSYIFKKTNQIANQMINPEDYLFSFQTNSIFDTKTKIPAHFVYTDHTHLTNLTYPSFEKKRIFSNGWIEREKSIYNNATKVFTYSENIKNSVINDYNCKPENVACIKAGSNLSRKNLVPLNNDNYRNKNIIFVGIDWARKGGPELLEAFKQILKEVPDAKLTIVGTSPEIDIPNCNVVGRVKIDELYKHYSEASIFCLPTKLEPFGIVFLEAMLNKLPVVSSKIGALPDLVKEGENGYLIEPGNVLQLKEALLKLLNSPDMCKSFGDAGYEHAVNNYTWDNVLNNLQKEIEPFIDTSIEKA